MAAKSWFKRGKTGTLSDAINSNPFLRFELRAPSAQTAIDVFRNEWACDLNPLLAVDGSGAAPLFTQDPRPLQLAQAFGQDGSLAGLRVLELGPLEGSHTYQLEALGAAEIIAVEANVQAWLKCLIVKETLNLKRSSFLLGDVIKYLESTDQRFDVVLASGILYHMIDPLALIANICRISDRCLIWSHYYRGLEYHPIPFSPSQIERDGFETRYWLHDYTPLSAKFWGGSAAGANWLERAEILRAFAHFGLSQIEIVSDEPEHSNGPCFTFTARR